MCIVRTTWLIVRDYWTIIFVDNVINSVNNSRLDGIKETAKLPVVTTWSVADVSLLNNNICLFEGKAIELFPDWMLCPNWKESLWGLFILMQNYWKITSWNIPKMNDNSRRKYGAANWILLEIANRVVGKIMKFHSDANGGYGCRWSASRVSFLI